VTTRSFTITLDDGVDHFTCRSDQNLLEAMASAGRQCIPAGCRGGGCGICKVQVLSGEYRTGVMSHAHVDPALQAMGYALACKVYPDSALCVRPAGTRALRAACGKPADAPWR
jgi:ferredoxin